MRGSVTIYSIHEYDPKARGVYGCCGYPPGGGMRTTAFAGPGPMAALARWVEFCSGAPKPDDERGKEVGGEMSATDEIKRSKK